MIKGQVVDTPEKILPNLFQEPIKTYNISIEGKPIESLSPKEKGNIDGAEIQINFKQ